MHAFPSSEQMMGMVCWDICVFWMCVYIYLQCLDSHLKCKTDNESPFLATLHIQLSSTKQKTTMTLIFFSTLESTLTSCQQIFWLNTVLYWGTLGHILCINMLFSLISRDIFSVWFMDASHRWAVMHKNIFFCVNFLFTIDFSRAKI